MDDNIIEVKDLAFSYTSNPEPVIKNINLKVKKGEFIGIIGPSGAGKTTLCGCLKGLMPHVINGTMSGSIEICGMNTRKSEPAVLSEKVGMVLQDPETQIIGLTVEEDLAFGPENLEWDRKRILSKIPEELKKVRLEGLEKRETYGISGGQKQRLAIAGALMMEPEVLILDEPTSELDPIGRQEVFSTIRNLKKERNITVIVVEQSVEELIDICDRIIVMKSGEIVANDSPDNVFKNKEILWDNNKGEIPLPQVVELMYNLLDKNIIPVTSITPYEDKAYKIIAQALEGDIR